MGESENVCYKRGGLSRNGEVTILYGVFLEIPHDAAEEKNLDVFIFPLLANMYYKIIAEVRYELTGIVINLVVLIAIIAVSIIHANNKHSA